MSEKKHYEGHRGRLRKRLLEKGVESLADYEVLELLLMLALPRRDVKPLAKELVGKFGSMSNVLSASVNELTSVAGVKENTASAIKLAEGIALTYRKENVQNKKLIDSTENLVFYLNARMASLTHEEVRVIYIDGKHRMIDDKVIFRGTLSSSAVYPREIVKEALNCGAASIVLAHNHPSGDPTPSTDDEIVTTEIFAALAPVDVELYDHLIIGDGRYYSFREDDKI